MVEIGLELCEYQTFCFFCEDWRPRRTIVFCGWGARVNSTTTGDNAQVQWAKENAQVLRQRAVAYLNLDLAVAGTSLKKTRNNQRKNDNTGNIFRQLFAVRRSFSDDAFPVEEKHQEDPQSESFRGEGRSQYGLRHLDAQQSRSWPA